MNDLDITCDHVFDNGRVTTQPTIFNEGIMTYTCNRCHYQYNEPIPRLIVDEEGSDLIDDFGYDVPVSDSIVSDNTLSENSIDYTELLTSIDDRIERIEQNVESISNNVIFIRDGINGFDGVEAGSVTVSDNSIMDKYLSDYTVSEALLLFISVSILIAGIVVIIKKGVPRWH